jgi:hypothetical protein
VVEKHLILNMSEFKRLEDRIQRWIRQAATQYEIETAPESQATVWGEFGNSHELPDELKRLLNDKDPQDDGASSEDELNEQEAPKFFSSWVQNIMKPTLDRLEALEKEVISLRKEVTKDRSKSKSKSKSKPKAEAETKTKTESKSQKATTSVGKKTATRARKKPTQPKKSSSPKRKSPAR